MRLISNIVVLLLVVWTISMAVTATIGLTVYFPFVISETGDIPKHREDYKGWNYANFCLLRRYAFIQTKHTSISD